MDFPASPTLLDTFAPPPEEAWLGRTVAGYRIDKLLGRGSHAIVFRAYQENLQRTVAIKVLLGTSASAPALRDRFLHEARCIAAVSHPNIVQVHDAGFADGVGFISMEEIRGRSLRAILADEGRLSPEIAVNLTKQCISGLERASRAGIVHRDIKPGNLLLDDLGTLKITDFGLSRMVESKGQKEVVHLAGTPLYMAPEQANNAAAATTAADQYSLGVTLYHLLTGEPPFNAPTARMLIEQHRTRPAPDPCILLPDLPPGLSTIVNRMMSKRPEDRFPTWRDLFHELEDFELRCGYIQGRSPFLPEGFINIGERSVRRLVSRLASGILFGFGLTALAIYAGERLQEFGWAASLAHLGSAGGCLLLVAFAMIMYIAAVRKGWLPRAGSLRVWLQLHIVTAILGYVLSMVHSANFFRFFGGVEWRTIPGGSRAPDLVPILPVMNALLFTAVVTSGFVGRYIWRDLANQVLAERVAHGANDLRENNDLTLAIFAHHALRYWRVFHYPLAMALILVTIAHILSVKYYGG